MIRDYLDKYCEILNRQIWEGYSAYSILVDLKHYLPQLKSEILLNCLNYDIDKKAEFLNYVANEIKTYTQKIDFDEKDLNKWLTAYKITLDKVVNANLGKEPIYFALEGNNEKSKSKTSDINFDNHDLFMLQNDFMQYFCKLFATEVINFCNENQPIKSPIVKESTHINKPFKDEYLKVFCKEINNERVIKETCFSLIYDSIIHYIPYFENEVMENLLLLNTDKKDDYLNFAIDTIKKTQFSDCDEKVIEKWLNKYNSSTSEFPNFENKELKHWLNRYYNGYADDPKDYDYILDIQIDFYCYAAGLEAQKMISFLESKKSTSTNNALLQSETTEKVKWIGKPSQLGFIIGKLADLGYIEAPKHNNGEINFTKFAALVNNTFEVNTTNNTLSKYLNLESEKGSETVRKFNDNGFDIPHLKTIS